jgi:hypothetical protein
MFTIRVRHDLDRLVEQFSDAERRQVPFATALALTRTAHDAQRDVRDKLPQQFHIRRPWVPQGIRVEPARKDNLVARVYSRDSFMAWQETGGRKPSGRHLMAVPVGRMRSVAATRVIPRSQWPGSLRNRPSVFREGGTLLERRGRGGAAAVRAIYLLRRSVNLRPRLQLHETVTATVGRVFPTRFGEAFAAAWAGRRT